MQLVILEGAIRSREKIDLHQCLYWGRDHLPEQPTTDPHLLANPYFEFGVHLFGCEAASTAAPLEEIDNEVLKNNRRKKKWTRKHWY